MEYKYKCKLDTKDIEIAYDFFSSTLINIEDLKDLKMYRLKNLNYNYEYIDLIDTYKIQGKEYSKIVFLDGINLMALLDDDFNGVGIIQY